MTRLLLVEDSPSQAEAIMEILVGDGFEVRVVDNGQRGWEALTTGTFDAVLSDVQMPVMDGYALCRRIKEDSALRKIPVLLLTILRDPMDVVRALECGADNFLTKPFDPRLLLARIRSLLASRQMRAGVPAEPGVDVFVMGHRVHVGSDNAQVLDFLISTLEDLVRAKQREQDLLLNELEKDKRATEVMARQTNELARSNAELEKFAQVAAHDLQAPLRTVTLCTEWLASEFKGNLGREADEFIEHAAVAARRMHRLIDDLLAYSRVQTKGQPFEPTDCTALLDELMVDLGPTLQKREGVLTRDPLPIVTADKAQLQQVFQNLIVNSIKFSGERPPVIHVSCDRRPEEWVFSLRDEGIGIPREDRDKVFEIFQRLHSDRDIPGTGLGLAICKKVVERHGGRIWVDSEPGQGATFHFTLPDAPAPAPPPPPLAA